ncbi:MAG: caspase family protein, partial [Candidatus Latescibacterota bacterium]
MARLAGWAPVVVVAAWAASAPAEAEALRRFVLAAGVNNGGVERELLRYAVSDAENFAQVLTDMGGLDLADCVLLRNPDMAAFDEGLGQLRQRVDAAHRWGGGRLEVIVYYSGHADEEGLLIGGQRKTYRQVRQDLAGMPADVHIVILDACASGSITRLKGGQRQRPFLVDESFNMRGYAFLTSSSAGEAAQESDRIRASFFTHYLVSGMRGPADASGDGRVTLDEAYQFAYHGTLSGTAGTRGGTQHPARELAMDGTGDVVMTDLRQTTAALVLGAQTSGRFYVRGTENRLIAEVDKRAGRPMELGLEPGAYAVHLEGGPQLMVATLALGAGQRAELGLADFVPTAREQTALRGDDPGRVKVALSDQLNLDIETGQGFTFSLGLLFNYQEEPFRGLQMAWLVNQAQEQLAGSQLSVFGNLAQQDQTGWQVSGMANWAVGALQGGQVAGALNIGRQVRGWQVSGSTNIARRVRGAQLGLGTNIATQIRGVQVGTLNAAGHMRGLQIGLVNLSGDIEGVPLGVFNYSHTGLCRLGAWRDDMGINYLSLMSGSRTFYTSFSLGRKSRAGEDPLWVLGFAAGRQFRLGPGYLELELGEYALNHEVGGQSEVDDSDLLTRLQLTAGWGLGAGWSLFGAASANVLQPVAASRPLASPRPDV